MNNLCRLSHVKRDIGGVGALSNTSDTVLGILQAVEDVSREFESETGRSFAATLKTIHIQRHQRACPDHLWLPEDVASISSLTVDNDGATTESGSYVAMENTAAPLTVGCSGVTATPVAEFHGRIAMPFVTGKALTAAEVASLYEIYQSLLGV